MLHTIVPYDDIFPQDVPRPTYVRDGDDIDVSPDPNRIFAKEDVVIVIGANDDMSDIK